MYTLLIFIAGAVAAFLVSDKALHLQLRKTKSAKQKVRFIGQAIAKHSKEVGHDARAYVASDGFQRTVKKGKRFVKETMHDITEAVKS